MAQRVFGLGLNDHDELRSDPVLGVLLGCERAAEAPSPLAGKSTLNRWSMRRGRARRRAITRSVTMGRLREAVRRLVSRRASKSAAPDRARSGPPTTRCTAIRKAGSFTATTTATATCRSMCSAAGISSPPSSGALTSTAAPGRSRRWIASRLRPESAGRRWRSCCAPIPASRVAFMAWCEANKVDYGFGLARNGGPAPVAGERGPAGAGVSRL
jgi:hypothetical protein